MRASRFSHALTDEARDDLLVQDVAEATLYMKSGIAIAPLPCRLGIVGSLLRYRLFREPRGA